MFAGLDAIVAASRRQQALAASSTPPDSGGDGGGGDGSDGDSSDVADDTSEPAVAAGARGAGAAAPRRVPQSSLLRDDRFLADAGSDSSEDERPARNTIGDVPLEWYEHEDHIGYDRCAAVHAVGA